jgi:DNA-binding IclR family transcriptional regulator
VTCKVRSLVCTAKCGSAREQRLRQDVVTTRLAPATDRKFVTALARGLEVLRCFSARDRWLTQPELVRRTGLAKPTVARLVHTLTQLGHLGYSASTNRYALGAETLSLGFSALGQMAIRRVARPPLQALSEHARAAVHLGVGDGLSMFLVDTYRHSTAFAVEVGSRVPVATTSMGRAWLSALPAEARRRMLERLRQASPEDWPRIRAGIDEAVAGYELHGYCLSLGDWRREVHAIAAPLVLPDASEPVVFGCSVAAFQLDPDVLRRDLAPRLLTVVGNIRSALLGSD